MIKESVAAAAPLAAGYEIRERDGALELHCAEEFLFGARLNGRVRREDIESAMRRAAHHHRTLRGLQREEEKARIAGDSARISALARSIRNSRGAYYTAMRDALGLRPPIGDNR